jgi:4-amino-4-deoxy-L-arabinose transferase-like glycosyltransferase
MSVSPISASPPWGSGLSTKRAVVAMVLLVGVCWFGIGRDLWTPDEPREAEVSREMWLAPSVVPTLNGNAFVEKPPLYYWTVAGVFELVGGASAWAARSVSAVASGLTLLLVFLWGRREFSTGIGLLAALGLATSAQFMISSHWVLIDPLLMLFTTVAAWAGWEVIGRDGGRRAVLILYTALVLALWTKGLIGPVLLGCGFVTHAIWTRSLRPILRLKPLIGIAAAVAATGAFAALVYQEAGFAAVREWFWVNHVLRFTEPAEYTGHVQPFYYYLVYIPTAVLPWWVPFTDVFRPRRWRDEVMSNRPLRVYLASLALGMAVILSASTTKRGIYLLPMLPPLALLLAAHAGAWFERQRRSASGTWPWWTQLALVAAFAVAPPAIAMAYVRRLDPLAAALAIVVILIVGVAFLLSRRDTTRRAVAALGTCAFAGVLSWLLVAIHFAGPEKNMTEFVSWIDEQLPAGESVYGFGSLDETFDGIVPFVTGRSVVALTADDIEQLAPTHIVVQDKDGGATAPNLHPHYELLRERSFGPGRYFAIWQRSAP